MNFRQGLYKEAVYLASWTNSEDSNGSCNDSLITSTKKSHSRSLSQIEDNPSSSLAIASHSLARCASRRRLLSTDGVSNITRNCSERPANGKKAINKANKALADRLVDENRSCLNSAKNRALDASVKRHPVKPESIVKSVNLLKMQVFSH